MKHSLHSRQRTEERVGVGIKKIRQKLAKREFIGLPRQTNNKRASLVILEHNAAVVIWSKSAHKIITVLTVDQYVKTFGHIVPEVVMKKLLKYCSKGAEKENVNEKNNFDDFNASSINYSFDS